MTMAYITDADIKRGKKTLKRALHAARKQPFDPDYSPVVPLAATILDPYTCISNLRALIIRKENGGWCAELLLKRVPAGWPDVAGTPSAQPLSSKNAALRRGYHMVNDLYQMERAGLAPKNPFPGEPIIVGNRVIFAAYDANW